ncbi:MAG: type III-B CRISPR module RAMP protein Cmr1 [Thermoproteota archaeon]
MKGNLLGKIKVENVTITRIGGYNARPYSSQLDIQEKPRSQAIRGVWRWWARALVAGAYYEIFDVLPSNLSGLDSLVSPVLGSTNQASKFIVKISPEAMHKFHDGNNIKQIVRIRLFRPPREYEEKSRYSKEETSSRYFNAGGLKFSIELMKRPHIEVSEQEVKFALLSLILSLTLGGVGSMTKRGFGSTKLKLDMVHTDKALEELLRQLYMAKDVQELQQQLNNLIDMALATAKGYLNLDLMKPFREKIDLVWRIESEKIPPYPVLYKKQIDAGGKMCTWFRLGVVEKPFRDPLEVLKSIGKASLKASWKRLKRHYSRESGRIHTWILGLPRSSTIRIDRGSKKTGYYLKEGKKDPRRPSAISFSVIPSYDNYYVVIHGFLSSDWIELLRSDSFIHVGKGEPVRSSLCELSERQIADIFEDAWESLREILNE